MATKNEIATNILKYMKPITLKINTQLETYPIIIGPNIIKDLSKYLKRHQ